MGVLIDGVTVTVKHKIKKQEVGFLGALFAPLVALIVQSMISSVVKSISGRRVRRAEKDKSVTHNIFRIQDNDSIMCWLYCIAFIEYMLSGKTLLNYTNLFSPNDYKKG